MANKGLDKNGRPVYEGNFPHGTPKAAKHRRILRLIQDVWSKKPLPLDIREPDGTTRRIEARFDPAYDPDNPRAPTDASKLMAGNRHGTSKDQRVTLDLADDWYEIAKGAAYNYSKPEDGKASPTHSNVRIWHYFVNDILFREYGQVEAAPYRVTINVKERDDGTFVYSISAENSKKRA